jgi:hypothetical protein
MGNMKTVPSKPALPSSITNLTPLELLKRIPVAAAAAHNSMHVDTFKKNYRHLIRRVGKRLLTVTVYDAITLPPPDTS